MWVAWVIVAVILAARQFRQPASFVSPSLSSGQPSSVDISSSATRSRPAYFLASASGTLSGDTVAPAPIRSTSATGGILLAAAAVGAAAAAASSARWKACVGSDRRLGSAMAVGAAQPAKRSTRIARNSAGFDRSDTKAFRKQLMRSDDYLRFGKTQMQNAMEQLKEISGSDLLAQVRKNGFRLTVGDVTFVLADSYGFCWGVERAVAMAYEAHNFFPDGTIWATNEIIHNPIVNNNLLQKGMRFIEKRPDGTKDFSVVKAGDVVVLPAFGATVDEMALLKERGVKIVDTTCPWVSKVWNSVEKTKDKNCTSVIHGKHDHEETVATKSFATKYIVVKDMKEAEYVAEYVLNGGDKDEFLRVFSKAVSDGFDPDTDLDRVGVANQTTMMKGETELIGKLFERVMIKKFGPQLINDHFVSFNTICDATEERQNAMYKMFGSEYEAPGSQLYSNLEGEQGSVALQSEKSNNVSSKRMEDLSKGETTVAVDPPPSIDLCLIVGGYNSSNTIHLLEIVDEEGIPGFHIDGPERIGGATGNVNQIVHKPVATLPATAMREGGLTETLDFLPAGPVVIGLTSGASTPDKVLGDCMKRILSLKGIDETRC